MRESVFFELRLRRFGVWQVAVWLVCGAAVAAMAAWAVTTFDSQPESRRPLVVAVAAGLSLAAIGLALSARARRRRASELQRRPLGVRARHRRAPHRDRRGGHGPRRLSAASTRRAAPDERLAASPAPRRRGSVARASLRGIFAAPSRRGRADRPCTSV